jgi:Right handed beta helix region
MFLRGFRASRNHSPRWSQIGACRKRRRRFAPGLLPLEPRALLSTLTVTSDADSGKGSLRAELALAQNGDTIVFSPKAYGTITLTSGPLEVATGVSIEGSGAGKLTVSGDDSSNVFDVDKGVTASISGLTITDGVSPNFYEAGGIFNQGTLTLTDAVVTGNSAPPGTYAGAGGIENAGTMTIADSTISHNYGPYAGGVNSYGPLTITDSTISGNSADLVNGVGGIESNKSLTITGSTISGNSGSDGAINAFSGLDLVSSVVSGNTGLAMGCFGTSTITDSQIVNNTNNVGPGGSANGGGINDNGDLTITGSTISGNTAEGLFAYGGGIEINSNVLTIRDCTIQDNQAIAGGNAWGGAVDISDSVMSVSDSSFVDNSANGASLADGGALFINGSDGSTTVVDCTFSGDQALAGINNPPGDYTAGAEGGAIAGRFGSSPLTISGSTFNNNSAQSGLGGGSSGGAVTNAGALTVSSSLFAGNAAIGGTDGGGAAGGALDGGAPATITGSTFIGNRAVGGSSGPASEYNFVFGGNAEGGAIDSGTLTVTDCVIAGNSATGGAVPASDPAGSAFAGTGRGGGIYCGRSLQVIGSTIVGNSAVAGANAPGFFGENGGGGVFISGTSARASFTDDLIALNATTVGSGDGQAYGGGIYIGIGALTTLTNTEVVGNKASTAGNNIYGTYTDG